MIDFISSILAQSASFVRAVVGAPDYDRYLAHMRSAHPGDRVMTETEFDHNRMNDRYNKPGSKATRRTTPRVQQLTRLTSPMTTTNRVRNESAHIAGNDPPRANRVRR